MFARALDKTGGRLHTFELDKGRAAIAAGHFKKAGVAPQRLLREVRGMAPEEFELGQQLKADVFQVGEKVDVVGVSKGKGYAQLVGVKSVEVPEMVRVKAGDPAGSYLWLKVTHTATKGRGMPRTLFGAKKLPQAELDIVESWIKAGAKP